MKQDMILARTDGKKLVPMTLAEWAARFNAEHRLAPPKEGK
jgi:hypothetical protein